MEMAVGRKMHSACCCKQPKLSQILMSKLAQQYQLIPTYFSVSKYAMAISIYVFVIFTHNDSDIHVADRFKQCFVWLGEKITIATAKWNFCISASVVMTQK